MFEAGGDCRQAGQGPRVEHRPTDVSPAPLVKVSPGPEVIEELFSLMSGTVGAPVEEHVVTSPGQAEAQRGRQGGQTIQRDPGDL